MRTAMRTAAVLATALLGLVVAVPALADDGAWKEAHDTDPHLPLTAQQLQMSAQKQQASQEYLAGTRPLQGASAGVMATNGAVPATAGTTFSLPVAMPDMVCACGGGGLPATAYFGGNQIPQITSYFCGPAAGKEAMGHLGQNHTQDTLSNWLHTTTDGTAWSGGGTSPSGYPFPDALNAHQSRNYYVPVSVSGTPTSGQISNYKSYLTTDIAGVGAPLVGDAWETPSSTYHLVGHPTNRTIFHWFEIRGYQSSGGSTMYEDSVSGSSYVSWSAGVPAYSTLSSTAIAHIIGGRGYVW